MLALAFTFPAGRYHATPWERHVNEGAVVWPPEPWRVLRALIATWHHKVKPADKHNEETLGELIEVLSQNLPEYNLPAASHSHTRHYMPQWTARSEEHTSELQSLMRISYAVFCLQKQNTKHTSSHDK